MVRKGLVRSTLQRLPRLTVKKVYPLTRFTGRKSRMRMTNLFPPMFRRKFFDLFDRGLRFPSCGESHIFPWGALLWGIVGSTVDPNFFEAFLGMRVEFSDMTESIRRMEAIFLMKKNSNGQWSMSVHTFL